MNPFAPKPERSRAKGAWLLAAFLSLFVLAACGTGDGDVIDDPTAGDLTVTIAGLPSGVDAAVTVTGDDGFEEVLTASETLDDLEPGEYVVTAADVAEADATYTADVDPETPVVVAGETTTVDVTYEEVDETVTPEPGTADPTFGDAGFASYAFEGTDAAVRDAEVEDDGSIIVAGTRASGSGSDLVLARIGTDGELDTTFGTGTDAEAGLTIDTFTGTIEALDMHVEADAIVVAFVEELSVDDHDVRIARFELDGTPDTEFPTTTADLAFDGEAEQVRVLDDGSVLVVGSADDPGTTGEDDLDLAITHYTAAGVSNTGFGESGGVTYVDQGPTDEALGVEVLADGRMLLYGQTGLGTAADFTVVLLDADGDIQGDAPGEPTFGTGDRLDVDFGGTDEAAFASASQGDDVILAGVTGMTDDDVAVVRIDTAGVIDPTFGGSEATDGLLVDDLGGDETVADVAVQEDGSIVVIGTTTDTAGDEDLFIARYDADGALDTSFGADGVATLDFEGDASAAGLHVLALDDDRIVIGGEVDAEAFVAVYHQ